MVLKIYNTLTRKKEIFKPIRENMVSTYWCGQTVYDSTHLGHARTYVVADVIRRWLKFRGYNVLYIENVTDIDDKIINRANELGITWKDLAEKYTKELEYVMSSLGIHVDFRPKATEYVPEMIGIVSRLLEKGYAYEISDGVYFDVSKFKKYGALSRQNLKDLKKHRTDLNPEKRNPGDFALWKKQKPGEPAWGSPWGDGRPGWHIECTAMSTRYLGESIDIHGGGSDLIFPHHENEIAQSEAYSGEKFVNYWMHVGLLQVKGEKMSKSLKNFIPTKDAVEKWDSEAIRLYLISSHYRKPMDFNEDDLNSMSKTLDKLYNVLNSLAGIDRAEGKFTENEKDLKKSVNSLSKKFGAAMDDDFNTPVAYTALNMLANAVNEFQAKNTSMNKDLVDLVEKTFKDFGQVFGILQSKMQGQEIIKGLIESIIEIRDVLRKEGKYDLADELREKLGESNILVEDKKDGTSTWRIK